MKKKEANLFGISPKIVSPPYMTAQQLRQFRTEFSLFHSQLDLEKLKEQLLLANVNSDSMKYIELFIGSLLQETDKCTFNSYIEELVKFLEKEDQGNLIMNVLAGDQDTLKRQYILELIEQTMDRDLSGKEETEVANKIFDASSVLTKEKVREIINIKRDKNQG